MLLLSKVDYEDLIGAPYEDGARGPRAFDCYGIVVEFYRRAGIIVPDYHTLGGSRQEHATMVLEAMENSWEELSEPEFGCVVLFRIEGINSHVGIMLNGDYFLHTIYKQSVVAQRLSHPHWENRIVGYYRYTGLVNGAKT